MEGKDILKDGASLTARKLDERDIANLLNPPEPPHRRNGVAPEVITDRVCPCCKSENIGESYKTENNGVFGPGYAAWKVDSKLVCNNCGVLFMPKEGNKKAPR